MRTVVVVLLVALVGCGSQRTSGGGDDDDDGQGYGACSELPDGSSSGVYRLSTDGIEWDAYCEMVADGGGWTLVLKVDGRQPTPFGYDSALWTTDVTLNESSTDLGQEQAKFVGFSTMPFNELRLGMDDAGEIRWLVLSASGSSLRQVFEGPYLPISAGRAAWYSLLASPSLEPSCDREGFNVLGDAGPDYRHVRLGIVGNNEQQCISPDSFIGFGGSGCTGLCGEPCGPVDIPSGNFAYCDTDNGDRATQTFGYLFLR